MGNSSTPPSMQDIMRLAQTQEGQQLIETLKQQNNPLLQELISSASQGNFMRARVILNALMEDPQVQSILNRMGGV